MKKSNGQSTVEYILMMLVITSVMFAVVNSDRFKEFFGEDSNFFKAIKKYIEFTYQHGAHGSDTADYNYSDPSLEHGVYVNENPKKGAKSTRFFIPKAKYPKE
jgi:hypothetical protein